MRKLLIAAIAALSATAWAGHASAQDGRGQREWRGGGDRGGENRGGDRQRGDGGERREFRRGDNGGGQQQAPQQQERRREWSQQNNGGEARREFRRPDGGGQQQQPQWQGERRRAEGRPDLRGQQPQQQPQQPPRVRPRDNGEGLAGAPDNARRWSDRGERRDPPQARQADQNRDRNWQNRQNQNRREGDRRWTDNNPRPNQSQWNGQNQVRRDDGARGGDDRRGDARRGDALRGDDRRGDDRRWNNNDNRRGDNRWNDNNRGGDRRWAGNEYRGYDGHRGYDRRWSDWRRVPHGGFFNQRYAHALHNHWGGSYYWWSYPNWRRPLRGYRVGYIIPYDLYWEPVPWEIYSYLPPPPYGCDYVMVGRDILLISLDNYLVIDALILAGY